MPARDGGVEADVSVQPGFVIIMRRKHRVLRYVVLPWTLRMTSAIKCHNKSGMSDRSYKYLEWTSVEIHGKLVDALGVGK